ncbi:hypothetical protein WJX72_006132 [[Myrmecia] bisecta]|uniref:Uncharacterized protein n=1 Tax=[Myrmecia] bisecta TaxID=41462 RepID=A0AAW1P8S0_9CHLO
MEFLMRLLSPLLARILDMVFLAGLSIGWHLQAAAQSKGAKHGGLLQLPLRTRRSAPKQVGASVVAAPGPVPALKELPNDRQRHGNIWQRYEQLENATKELSSVNKQLVDEKAKHLREKKRYESLLAAVAADNKAILAHLESLPASPSVRPLVEKLTLQQTQLAGFGGDAKYLRSESMDGAALDGDSAKDAKLQHRTLTQDLSFKAALVQELKDQNRALDEDNKRLKSQLAAAAVATVAVAVPEGAARLEQLQADKDGTEQQAAMFKQQLEQLTPRHEDLQEQHRALVEELNALKSRPAAEPAPAVAVASAEDAARLQQLQAEKDSLEQQVVLFKQQFEQLGPLHDELQQNVADLEPLRRDNARLQKEVVCLAALRQENDQLQQQVANMAGTLWSHELDDLKRENGELKQRLEEALASEKQSRGRAAGAGVLGAAAGGVAGFGAALFGGSPKAAAAQQSRSIAAAPVAAAGRSGSTAGLEAELAALREEKRQLEDDVALLAADSAQVQPLQHRVQRLEADVDHLTAENQALRASITKEGQAGGSKGGKSSRSELQGRLQTLELENALLAGRVAKLVSEARNAQATPPSPSGAAKDALAVENQQLAERNSQLAAQLAQVQSRLAAAQQNQKLMAAVEELKRGKPRRGKSGTLDFRTIPVPVSADTGEELDPEVWRLLEDMKEQNGRLLAERDRLNAQLADTLMGVAPAPAPVAKEASALEAENQRLATEAEQLRLQLEAVMESKAAEINDDNIRLVNQLTQENAKLEADVLRLSQQMTAGINDGDVQTTLISMQATNDRLVSHKRQMLEENSRLAEKNSRLVEENEALLARIAVFVGDGPQRSGSIWNRFQAFKKTKTKSTRSHDFDDSSSLHSSEGRTPSQSEPQAQEALVRELTEENARLQSDNARLNASMVLVKELTDENTRLAAAQEQLNSSLKKVLEDNAELNNRLIEIALQSDDLFGGEDDAGFDAPARYLPAAMHAEKAEKAAAALAVKMQDTEEMQKRHREISEQVRQQEESQEAAAVRRQDLMQRSSSELAAHEQAYKRAKASALSRLNSYNRSLAERPVTPRGQGSERADAPLTPEQLEGQMMRTRSVAGVPQGELDEGKRRRQEAELAKAELEKKIAASRARHQAEAAGAAPAVAGRKELEEQRRIAEQRQKAQEQVRAAYYRFAGNGEVGKFLQALGFQGFESRPGDDLSEVFRSAIRFTQPERVPGPPKWDTIFTQAVHQKLQEWYSEWMASADL